MVNNTLKPNALEEFVPMNGRQIKFYNCGPTVYDASHMGHARTYTSVDMIRRILTKYFNYDVFYAMNITDIDDKIIARSNEKGEEYLSFAKKWEADYWQDMQALGIDYPDSLVRVSEHVEEISKFIQTIIDNGYAYESNGSVYFDVKKFMEAPNHFYAKLDPAKARDEGAQDEDTNTDKRFAKDFALWKKAKPGEPKWPSKWSEGRPGWHIECSAMADYVLGYPIDIHMGGIDLKFPHHDNEIAQSEAFYNKPTKEENNWVNYFIHTGHLNINGLKMGKSLKNFITIKNMLKHFSARQIKLLFVLHQYDSLMNYNPHEEKDGKVIQYNSMREPIEKEKVYTNFFRTAIAILRQTDITTSMKWNTKDFEINEKLMKSKATIHAHFLNNFNTKGVIVELDYLIQITNLYIQEKYMKASLINKIFNYVRFIFEVIGLDFDDKSSSKDNSKEQFLTEIQQLSKFRDSVREFVQNGKQFDKVVESAQIFTPISQQAQSEVSKVFVDFVQNVLVSAQEKDIKKVMGFCDNIRDQELPQLGIKIDDRNGQASLWKEEDKTILMKEINDKKEAAAKKELEKQQKREQELAQMKIDPSTIFINDPENAKKFSKYDEKGIPSHDLEGKELSKKSLKYYQKEYEKQLKKFTEFQKLQEQETQK